MGCASSNNAHVILVVNKGWVKKPHVSKTRADKERLKQLKDVPKKNGRATEIFKQRKTIYNDEDSFGEKKERSRKENVRYHLESDQSHSRTSVLKWKRISKMTERMIVAPPQQSCVSSKMSKYKTKSTGDAVIVSCASNQCEKMEEPSLLIKDETRNDNATKISNELPCPMNLKRTEEWNFNGLLFTDPLYNDIIAVTVHCNFFNDFGDNFDDLDLS